MSLILGLSACAPSAAENPVTTDEPNRAVEEPIATPITYVTNGRDYIVDVDNSTMTWTGARVTDKGHTGNVNLLDGFLSFHDNSSAEGEFIIDMTSITEEKDSEMFLKHINGEDFFDVENYPTSTIKVTSLEPRGGADVEVTGDLTILDQTHEITFPATLTNAEEGNFEELHADATFTIDRTRWGVIFDSGSIFKDLGEKAIKDEITYTLNLWLKLDN